MNAQQTQATQLSAAIRVKDLDGAQGAYQRMRPMYEQIEVCAGQSASFPGSLSIQSLEFSISVSPSCVLLTAPDI